MATSWPRSTRSTVPQAAWLVLLVVNAIGIGAGVTLFWYALIPLRAEKLEVVYRVEGVPFMAGPQGVPAEKWERMSAVDLEIVEPMADWVQGAGAALFGFSIVSMMLLWRMRPASPAAEPEETTGLI